MRALSGGKSRLIKRLVLGLTLLFLESVLLGQKAFQKVRRAGFESTRRRAPTTVCVMALQFGLRVSGRETGACRSLPKGWKGRLYIGVPAFTTTWTTRLTDELGSDSACMIFGSSSWSTQV
ncbi:hypothetical protein IWX92DRAFT_369084 [Phyllosticta citricarpa]